MPRLSPVVFIVALGCMPAEGSLQLVKLNPCSTVPTASCVVRITDSVGTPAPADAVTYQVDGLSRGDCTSMDEDHTVFVCGWDEVGEFRVSILHDTVVQEHTFEISPMTECGMSTPTLDLIVDADDPLGGLD
jgi:hypothetical protein